MIAFSNTSLILLAIGALVLNVYAFRSDARAAGHGRKQMIRMAAIWAAIIAALVLVINLAGL